MRVMEGGPIGLGRGRFSIFGRLATGEWAGIVRGGDGRSYGSHRQRLEQRGCRLYSARPRRQAQQMRCPEARGSSNPSSTEIICLSPNQTNSFPLIGPPLPPPPPLPFSSPSKRSPLLLLFTSACTLDFLWTGQEDLQDATAQHQRLTSTQRRSITNN